MIELIVLASIWVLVFVVLLARALRLKKVTESVERDSAKWGLAITPEVLPILLRRRRASALGYAIGTPLGFVGGWSTITVVLHLQYSLAGSLIPQLCWRITGGIGALVGGLLGARSVRMPDRRIARDHAVTIDDYVEPVERRVAWIVAAIALAVGLVPVVHGGRGPDAMLAAGAALGAVAVVAGTSFVSRRLVERPQRADTAVLLAWDDAHRAATLRSLVAAAAALALFSIVVTFPIAVASTIARAVAQSELQIDTAYVATALLITGAIWAMRQKPTRYFLRRLWPSTAAEADANERAAMEVQP